MRNGQRCLHSPAAKFLSQTPPTLPFRNLQVTLSEKFGKHLKDISLNTNVLKNSSLDLLHDKQTLRKNKDSQHENSNLKCSPLEKDSAPKIKSASKYSTTDFIPIVRGKQKKKKTFTLSPKKYYSTQRLQSKKESFSKLSPFLQYKQILEQDTSLKVDQKLLPMDESSTVSHQTLGASNTSPESVQGNFCADFRSFVIY